MKYRIILLEQLSKQPYFEKAAVRQLSEPYGLKAGTVDTYLSQSIKRKDIIPLRKSLYVTTDFYEKHRSDVAYSFYLANVIRKPSYISTWAALQYYNLATEAIHATTSVTTRLTRDFETRVGAFTYQSIQPDLFVGFTLEKRTFDYYIASPAKALFDLLYFRTRQFRNTTLAEVPLLVEELRIDMDEMTDSDRDAFQNYLRAYLHG